MEIVARCPPVNPLDFADQATSRTEAEGLALCGVLCRVAEENHMTEIKIDEEYRAGFIEGFKSARGADVADPEVPPRPRIPNANKARDLGWHDGRLHGLDATVPDDPEDSK
jgi:hypothetical protein